MSMALAFGSGITAKAAAGWAMENGKWVYYDNSGYMVVNEWKKGLMTSGVISTVMDRWLLTVGWTRLIM